MAEGIGRYTPLPQETNAYVCTNCGAVSLRPDGIYHVQGRLMRGEWCGTKSLEPARVCQKKIHNLRFTCRNCGRVSVDAGLLCEPEQTPDT